MMRSVTLMKQAASLAGKRNLSTKVIAIYLHDRYFIPNIIYDE